MKKVLLMLAVLPMFLLTINIAKVSAQETTTDTDVTTQEETVLTNADKKFTVYVREGCPHCAQVKAFVTRNNLEDNITYIETYNNPQNATKLEEEFSKYDAPSSDQGVPFMPVDDTSYKVGDTPIINYLAEQFGLESEIIPVDESAETVTSSESSGSDKAILFGGALVLMAIAGYGIYATLNKKDA